MNKLQKSSIASLMASVAVLSSGFAFAESPLTANIGVSSNYIWRGVTQTTDQSAVSGGIDYAHSSGFYTGTWVSNQNWTGPDNYEQDVYLGYGFEAGPVGLDFGYINYSYPVGPGTDDFAEAYVNLSYEMLTLGVASTTSKESEILENDTYSYLGAEFEVRQGLSLGLLYGNYDYEDDNLDYTHVQVSLSKDDFTFSYDATDMDAAAGDARITVSWGQTLDL
ncbi:MAG: TorF family putative porin [Gammaproteobacteria bacterium]|nr:TorF family putative porin [Gammaproteobacteria bacterium]